MELQISEDDLLEFACSCMQYLKKIGNYEPMCGDTFTIDKKELRKVAKSFLNQHYKRTSDEDRVGNVSSAGGLR